MGDAFYIRKKIFLCCNTIPNLSSIDGGVMRRLKIIEFTSDAKISQDNIHLYSQLNLEHKLFESDPRTDEIVKL